MLHVPAVNDQLSDPAKDVGVEAKVALGNIEAPVHKNVLLQGAGEVVEDNLVNQLREEPVHA